MNKKQVEQEQKNKIKKLFKTAEHKFNEFEYEECSLIIEDILKINKNSINSLNLGAICLINMDRPKEAIKYFKQSVKISPKTDYFKYMYLGQLSIGFESVKYYKLGITFLEEKLKVSCFIFN